MAMADPDSISSTRSTGLWFMDDLTAPSPGHRMVSTLEMSKRLQLQSPSLDTISEVIHQKNVKDKQADDDFLNWDWVIDIRNMKDENCHDHGEPSIFKVPRNLLVLQPNAFIPQVVSIGPYHRGKPHLQEMEKHKWSLLVKLVSRTRCDLHSLVQLMAGLEARTRRCYDKFTGKHTSKENVKWMLLDACFILEMFRAGGSFEVDDYSAIHDSVVLHQGISPYIQRDLLMLENQIPLFVLNAMFDFIHKPPPAKDNSLLKLALKFFHSAVPCVGSWNWTDSKQIGELRHILDIVGHSMLPEEATFSKLGADEKIKNRSETTVMHSVTNLRGTGVKFRRKESGKLLDIEFKEGVLYIPRLIIHDSTKSIFLNLMAFEKFYPHSTNHMTSYISFMDGLIDSPRDADYLHGLGIIGHSLGSDKDVADLFNNLRKEIVFDTNNYYLSDVSDALHKHFRKRWNGWRSSLKHEYLKDPWKIISLVAASLLIFLTMAQVVYAVLAYHLPNEKNPTQVRFLPPSPNGG